MLDALLDQDTAIQTARVSREVVTPNNKRLDIVIEGLLIVGIENKIFASAYNDFTEYSTYLESIAQGIPTQKIVLSVHPISEKIMQETGFRNILYVNFIQRIRVRLGQKAHFANMNLQGFC